jgi:hypothetical protein
VLGLPRGCTIASDRSKAQGKKIGGGRAAAAAALFLVPQLCALTRRTVAGLYRRKLAKNSHARRKVKIGFGFAYFLKPCVARLRARFHVKIERGCPIFTEGLRKFLI